MNKYFFITDFRNLSNYLSLGFIIPNHISFLTSKYYHIPINTWNQTVLYQEVNIPKNLPDSAVIVDLGDILDKNKFSIKQKGNFIKDKDGNIIFGKLNKYENYLPITFISKIIFYNHEMKERFEQMEFTNTFVLEHWKYEINDNFYSNRTAEDNEEMDVKDELFKTSNYKEEFNFDKYDSRAKIDFKKPSFNSDLTLHYTIADFALSNNIYNKELDYRIPANYNSLNKSKDYTELISNLLKLKKIADEEIPSKLFNSMVQISDNLIETDIFLWYAIFYNLMNIEHQYKNEEVNKNYIDQIKYFKFDKVNIEHIGKHLAKLLGDIKDDENLKCLRTIHKNINNLDIHRNSILDEIKSNGSELSIMIFKFLMDLISYSNQVNKLRSIYIDQSSLTLENLLIKILFYQYIGFAKIPKKIKQKYNWEFILDSFANYNYISINKKLIEQNRETWMSKIRRTFNGEKLFQLDSSKESITINKQKFIFNHEKIDVSNELDKYKMIIPVKDKYGILYNYEIFLESEEHFNLGLFEKYLKAFLNEEYSNLLENKYKSMSSIDKMKFLSYLKTKSS